MNIKHRNLNVFFAIFVTLFWNITVNAHDGFESNSISGEYGMTSTQSCVRTPFVGSSTKGFDDNNKSLLLMGESVSAIGSGLMRFNHDGSVIITDGLLTEILNDKINPGDLPVNALAEFSCAGKYIRHPGRKIDIELECSVKSQSPGVTVSIKPFHFEGYVGRGLQTLQLSLIEGNVQTVLVSVGGQVVQQRERICVQSASLSRI